MALSKEKQEDFPPQVAENCACLAMRCRDADQMSDLYRVFFLHRIESITKRVKLLVKCLCEYHSTSSFMYYVFSRLTTPDASNKNLLLKFMLTLGGSSVNLSAFNLNIASSSFLKNCTLPANIPEFASESVLSRPCQVILKESQSERIYASWEKTMLKLHESLNVQVLTDQALMRAMLACKILTLLELKNGSKAFKISERGRLLLDEVFPCKLETTKAWPASAMCLYVFFEWIQRNDVVQAAVDEFISKNQTTAQNFGYRLQGVKINSPESIIITMVSLKTHDVNNYRCRYDHERCGFVLPVGRGGVLIGTPVLMKIMMLCSMAYVVSALKEYKQFWEGKLTDRVFKKWDRQFWKNHPAAVYYISTVVKRYARLKNSLVRFISFKNPKQGACCPCQTTALYCKDCLEIKSIPNFKHPPPGGSIALDVNTDRVVCQLCKSPRIIKIPLFNPSNPDTTLSITHPDRSPLHICNGSPYCFTLTSYNGSCRECVC